MTGDTAQWVTLLTVIAGFLYQEIRVTRQRRWDKEDRAELAANLKHARAELAQKVETAAYTATALMVNETTRLSDAIEANTQISTKAFREANSVNMKIAALGVEHNALQRAQSRRAEEEQQEGSE